MMAVVFLLFCGENAYSNLYDTVSEKMYRLYFHSTYDTEEMESYFDELFKRYGVTPKKIYGCVQIPTRKR